MKPMVRMASKRGAREMSGADQLDAVRREPGMAHPELPRAGFLAPARARSPEHSAATSRDKTG
jgi:hypothetical protein